VQCAGARSPLHRKAPTERRARASAAASPMARTLRSACRVIHSRCLLQHPKRQSGCPLGEPACVVVLIAPPDEVFPTDGSLTLSPGLRPGARARAPHRFTRVRPGARRGGAVHHLARGVREQVDGVLDAAGAFERRRVSSSPSSGRWETRRALVRSSVRTTRPERQQSNAP
jgi:hypothetical protein